MRWFEFIREAIESGNFESYVDRHWKEVPDEDVWSHISCEPLEEDFIRRHFDMVDWASISKRSKLSESFIEEFRSCVDWMAISMYQHFDSAFADRHRYELHWRYVFSRYQYPETMIWSLIRDPFVDTDFGNILTTQRGLSPKTIECLNTIYRRKEIEELFRRSKQMGKPVIATKPAEKPDTGFSLFRIFKNKKKVAVI